MVHDSSLTITRFKTLPKQGVRTSQLLEQPFLSTLQPFPNCPQPCSTYGSTVGFTYLITRFLEKYKGELRV